MTSRVDAKRLLPTALLLAVSLALTLTALDWGLPTHKRGWAFDEIDPHVADRAARARFSGGWAANYPPLQYALLHLAQEAARALAGDDWEDLAPPARDLRLRRAGRLLTACMATLLIWGVYRCARLFAGRWEARLAAFLCATCLPFVYYSKTTNVDVPYLMWLVASAWLFVRALQRGRLRDYVLLGCTAAAATATKDQAYAFYGAMPFFLVASLWKRPAWRVLLDRRLWAVLVCGLAAYAVLSSLAFNWDGFLRHVNIITSRSVGRFDDYPNTVGGHLAMARQSLLHLAFAMSWPVFLASLGGVALALRRPRRYRPQLALLACAASYYVLFISITRHNFVRFLLPITLVLAFFAAAAVRAAWESRLPRAVTAAALALGLAFALGRAAAVDGLMLGDSRYAAEAWLADHVPADAEVGGVGRAQMLPRGVEAIPWHRIHRVGPRRLDRRHLDYVVFSRSGLWAPRDEALFHRLTRPGSGFSVAARIAGERPWLMPSTDGLHTNFDKISPEIWILRRDG